MTDQFSNFIRAFSSGCCGCVRECCCGKIYYDMDGDWDWEEGELESLTKDEKAKATDDAVGTIIFNNNEYVDVCNCWHQEAITLIKWMENNQKQFYKFLELEYDRKQQELQITINPAENSKYYTKNTWQPIATAPRNSQTIEVLLRDEKTILKAHYACDLRGEEQPAFEGWFSKINETSYGQIEDPIAWREIKENNE